MVSQRELEKIVEQINESYKVLLDKITALEEKAALPQKEAKVKK
jgi:hypothetical protein